MTIRQRGRSQSGPQGTPDRHDQVEYEFVSRDDRDYRFIVMGVVKQEVVPGKRAKLTLTDLKVASGGQRRIHHFIAFSSSPFAPIAPPASGTVHLSRIGRFSANISLGSVELAGYANVHRTADLWFSWSGGSILANGFFLSPA